VSETDRVGGWQKGLKHGGGRRRIDYSSFSSLSLFNLNVGGL